MAAKQSGRKDLRDRWGGPRWPHALQPIVPNRFQAIRVSQHSFHRRSYLGCVFDQNH
jgi:hypothetical protein